MKSAAMTRAGCMALAIACNTPPAPPQPVEQSSAAAVPSVPFVAPVSERGRDCPPGMVRVAGTGRVGMRGNPYGVVQTAHMQRVDAPERLCGDAVASTEGASACWVQTDLVDPLLRPRDVALTDFCIERFPFPGPGAQYPADGMTAGTVAVLDEMLKTGRFGPRRLCLASEYQLAVAGPKGNARFVYGDVAVPQRCKAGALIGSDASCVNSETGVAEYGAIHSHWVRADAAFVASACDAPPCNGAGNRPLQVGSFVVMGGTDRVQTRQAPLTPHTWHDHGEPADVGCGDEGWDDQVVICADLTPAYSETKWGGSLASAEAAWAEVVDTVRKHSRVTAGLAQGLGRSVCPGR